MKMTLRAISDKSIGDIEIYGKKMYVGDESFYMEISDKELILSKLKEIFDIDRFKTIKIEITE